MFSIMDIICYLPKLGGIDSKDLDLKSKDLNANQVVQVVLYNPLKNKSCFTLICVIDVLAWGRYLICILDIDGI